MTIILTGTIATRPSSVVSRDKDTTINDGPNHIQCWDTVPPKINIGSTLINVTMFPLDCDSFEDDDNLIDFLYTKFITADLIRKPNLNIQKKS